MNKNDLLYTAEDITEMCDTWMNFNGFSGETCGSCHKTASVFGYGSGWICDCGHYNAQCWSSSNIPHEKPDMGTPAEVIRLGIKNSKRWQNLIK